jgi:nitrogen fixation-related uncharacterized protein
MLKLNEPRLAEAAALATSNGALWVLYHAVKSSQWEDVDGRGHRCPYCGKKKHDGHHKDCMIGNGMRMMAESIAQPEGEAAQEIGY